MVTETKVKIWAENYAASLWDETEVPKGDPWEYAKEGFIEGFKTAMGRWYSTRRRLPDYGEPVITSTGHVLKRTASHRGMGSSGWVWEADPKMFFSPDEVEAWLPLPKYQGKADATED